MLRVVGHVKVRCLLRRRGPLSQRCTPHRNSSGKWLSDVRSLANRASRGANAAMPPAVCAVGHGLRHCRTTLASRAMGLSRATWTNVGVLGMRTERKAICVSVLSLNSWSSMESRPTFMRDVSTEVLVRFCQKNVGNNCTPEVSLAMSQSTYSKPGQPCLQSSTSVGICIFLSISILFL